MDTLTFEKPHWEALTPLTQEVFRLLSKSDLVRDFYLAGGTALALHFGHRYSDDLDFFSEEKNALDFARRSALRSLFDEVLLTILYDNDSTFVINWQGIGVSFFCLDFYPLVRPVFLVDGIRVASVEEIGAMKLAALINRGNRKDMVDLYFILQHVPLESLFEVAAVKYAKIRSFAVNAVRAMAYFEDAESLPMPRMIDKTPWQKMKKFIEAKAIEAGRRQLEDLWEI